MTGAGSGYPESPTLFNTKLLWVGPMGLNTKLLTLGFGSSGRPVETCIVTGRACRVSDSWEQHAWWAGSISDRGAGRNQRRRTDVEALSDRIFEWTLAKVVIVATGAGCKTI